jgi:predicted DNA-binding protein
LKNKNPDKWPVPLTCRVSNEVNDRLLQCSAKENISKTKIMRRAIEVYLNMVEDGAVYRIDKKENEAQIIFKMRD